MKKNDKRMIAKVLTTVTNNVLSIAANSRCMIIYHQPKQPDEVKKFRRF